jgi:hypothetical protein
MNSATKARFKPFAASVIPIPSKRCPGDGHGQRTD